MSGARAGRWLDGLRRRGVDVSALADAALDDVAHEGPPGTWGDRHVLAPVLTPAGAPAPVPPTGLSGDGDCVLATSSTPGVSDACWRGPVARYVWDLGDRANSRWIVPFGASGRPGDPHFADQLPLWAAGVLVPVVPDTGEDPMTVYEEKLSGLGRLTLERLDPGAHAALVHGWVTLPQNRFWGMAAHSVDDVREIYAFVDSLPSHHAYLIRLDDVPIGLFQTYEPEHDPVGEQYPVEPGDIGMHLLLSPGRRPPRGLTDAVGPALARFLFRDPSRQRIVVEPDVRNHRALRRLETSGFTLAGEITLADKRAQLAFLTRSRFDEFA